MPKISLTLISILLPALFFVAATGEALAESGSEAAVKIAFLYNFFKFIEWPLTVEQQSYRLCTTTNDQLGDGLSLLESKNIRSKKMVVRRDVNGEKLKHCHMVFIGATEKTVEIIAYLQGLPIVTVSDQPNFIAQGGMIGLIQDGNRLNFEINLKATNTDDVHVSAKLLKLAKTVITAK
jgi:hypothetical protein